MSEVAPITTREMHTGGEPVRIEAETPLNEKLVSLVTTLRGREIIMSRPFGPTFEIGRHKHIAIHADNLLLFDAQTGRRMDPKTNGEARKAA